MRDWKKFYHPLPTLSEDRTPRVNVYSFGPSELHLGEEIIYEGGPEEFVRKNPQLFRTGTTSRDEGFFYWGLWKVIGKENVPGNMGISWTYQSKVGGGSTTPGGAVVDFIIRGVMQGYDLGVRIVTKRFHNQAGPLKQATDEAQRFSLLENGVYALDIQSKDYIFDKTGRAAIRAVNDALTLTPGLSPIYSSFETP